MLYSFLINVLRVAKAKLSISVDWKGGDVGVGGAGRMGSTQETLGQLPPESFLTGSAEGNSGPFS